VGALRSGGCSLFDTVKLRQMGGVSEYFDPAYVEDLDLGLSSMETGLAVSIPRGPLRSSTATVPRRPAFTPRRNSTTFVERNYLRFLIHAVGSPALFPPPVARSDSPPAVDGHGRQRGRAETLRRIPKIAHRPPSAAGTTLGT